MGAFCLWIVLLYWKVIEKKPLSMMGINRYFGSYFIGIGISVFLLLLCIGIMILAGKIEYCGISEKSIWEACGLHSFWNAILYSVLGLNLSGNDENGTTLFQMRSVGENIWNGGVYGIEASVVTTVVLGVSAIVLWKYGEKRAGKLL